ncbi:glycoside hydrolase family 10 protein [Leptothoe sp. PORK10 BA2]|uniref:glycoside hydrolase family 10 protein n=1 Tax=Leptothoe sp. PORK10 BA2 TaxID=3110254 RepID=UPI002B1EB62E|nr:family 10 glycosylhydrolase [Leptothoe sp. PORK10 BA2]MEA5464360.1 family 10 glycosylhydrolase [Leptothoe sp. PORK10 BA2]
MSEAIVPEQPSDKLTGQSSGQSSGEARAVKRAKLAQRKQRRYFALGLLALWLVLSCWQAPAVPLATTNQIRGVWMTNTAAAINYYGFRLDDAIANLAEHQINTLYPSVWNQGYTLYPSQVTKAAGGSCCDRIANVPLYPFDDILHSLTRQAHRHNMRLIPWFEYGLMIPASSPIAQAHPEWLTTNQLGKTVPAPLSPHPLFPNPLKNFQLEISGGNLAWLNPMHPEVQQFVTDLIVDVVQRYPVDGIQLDDHFSLPMAMGYDPYTVQLYQNSHGGSLPPEDPSAPEWVAWRAQYITALLADITKAVKQVRPEAIISVSPNPPGFAYSKYLQDWVHWVNLGIVDEVVVQLYRDDLGVFEQDLYNSGFHDLRNQVPIAIGIYTGPLAAAKDFNRTVDEIAAVQQAGYRGVSFFSWETTFWFLKKVPDLELRQALDQLFQSP